ncbi:MAG: CheR family methyltransferase [Polyangiales bacterium]
MSDAIDASLVERFRLTVEERTGLGFVPGKTDDLLELLRQRSAVRKLGAAEYVARLERGDVRDELRELAPLLTVAETYFFRNPAQFDAFRALAYRHMTQPDTRLRPLSVLSAGCASGEEAYSLAIAAREVFNGSACTAEVVAVDLNPQVLERARRGRYSEWSLRSVGSDVRARWFRARGHEVQLDPSVRESVRFVEGNLVQPDPALFGEQRWDIVFCRNALMYFTPDKLRLALDNLTRALMLDGHLFLGHAETLRGLRHDYHLCHTHDAFYYQRKRAPAAEAVALTPRRARPPSAPPPPLPAAWPADADRASTRVRQLDPPKPPPSAVARDLSAVVDLMHRDQHIAALALFSSLGEEAAPDPDALLVEANLLTHANRFTAAQAVCDRLLALDELNAGAHYVLALCREAAGDLDRALHHDQVSAYLDPAFAMPHVHMGLLLRRRGQEEAARTALTHAYTLLEREDTARLAMFGGGFGRAALLALCVSQASHLGETS